MSQECVKVCQKRVIGVSCVSEAGPSPPKGYMGYSPRPPAVKGPQKGKKVKKAYENRLSRDLGAPKI